LHSPSEHTIDGKVFDAVMHMVFKGVTYKEELAVVSLFFEGDENAKGKDNVLSLFKYKNYLFFTNHNIVSLHI
jgi:carbonic anhydrase